MLLPLHIICFLHLLCINYKCTQPCYFPLPHKSAAQKVKMDWNSLTRSFRLCAAPVAIPVELWSLPLFRFERVILVHWRHYLYNKYILFMIFVYLWTLYVHVCKINDHMQWVLGFACKIGYATDFLAARSARSMLSPSPVELPICLPNKFATQTRRTTIWISLQEGLVSSQDQQRKDQMK
jgi:hypothetical protein